MSRNFYILAAALGFFALLSGGMTLVPSSFQPGLPANGSLWRTVALLMLLAALACALIGVMSNLFEQVDRRSEEDRQAARRKRKDAAATGSALIQTIYMGRSSNGPDNELKSKRAGTLSPQQDRIADV